MVLKCKLNTEEVLKHYPVKWYKNGEEIPRRDDDYRIISNGRNHSLTIRRTSVEKDNLAEFRVKCSNQEIVTKLYVKEQDAVFDEKLPSELKLKTEQENAKLQCSTNIAKNVELKWTKGIVFKLTHTKILGIHAKYESQWSTSKNKFCRIFFICFFFQKFFTRIFFGII